MPNADRPRRSWLLAAGLAVLVPAAAGTVWLLVRPQQTSQAQPAGPAVRTAPVQRTQLALSQLYPGTLGFGADQPVKGAGSGLVTKLPQAGQTAERGTPLFWVNDQPVPVFYGTTPLFRKLEVPQGDPLSGGDVAVVADNLRALGYQVGAQPKTSARPGEAGKPAVFTPALGAALKKWQQKSGLPATGTLEPGQVLVLPGPSRVSAVTAQLGDPAAAPLLSVTGTAKAVSAEVPATDAAKLKPGAEVSILRPDSKELPAAVSQVGPAQSKDGQPKVTVTVLPKDSGTLSDVDGSVQVKVVTEARPDVLAVPLSALVALREGGYAVQLSGGELKPVHTGLFAKDLVEISGPGITEGLPVVTAS